MGKLSLKRKYEKLPDDELLDFKDYSEEDEYKYLRWKRPHEKFTRVDRYSIVRYWSHHKNPEFNEIFQEDFY